MGNSGSDPQRATESCFVADEGTGLDVRHPIRLSGTAITLTLETNRVVGTVDTDGFLALGGLVHVGQGTLAETLTLTVRALISAVDAGGTLGRDQLDVEVILHRGFAGHERSLGHLVGLFGGFVWQTFQLDVDVQDVRFPADPCAGQNSRATCGQRPVPRPNEISFVFTGSVTQGAGIGFEVDWITLAPKTQPGLAWRPVLLVPGWNGGVSDFEPAAGPGAWPRGLTDRNVGFGFAKLDSIGTVEQNGAALAAEVSDLKNRFGVERINILGHCKGGLDAREHARRHDDVDVLIMLAAENEGSFLVDAMPAQAITIPGADPAAVTRSMRQLTSASMRRYNRHCGQNPKVEYVAAAVIHDSPVANAWVILVGGNDEFVSAFSVQALPYADRRDFFTTVADPECQACGGSTVGLGAHICLVTYPSIVDGLFPLLAGLTAPLPAAGLRPNPSPEPDPALVQQGLGSLTALVPPDGSTQTHPVVVDPVETASFLVFVESDLLRLTLVSPTGRRIGPQTPLTDAAVVHAPLLDSGPFCSTGYHVQAPETGEWTLEVSGTGAPPAGASYAVSTLARALPGVGVGLAVTAEPEQCAPGVPVLITASLTADGAPLPGATVRAEVLPPEGEPTELVLTGDGSYTGTFSGTSATGSYALVVTAAGTGFTREQQLDLLVVPSATTFAGSISDRGADSDGDGRFEQLVVDVGVDVDLAAVYRVLGTLRSAAGAAIERVQVESPLVPGPGTVSLAFDGGLLFALDHDGPYLLDDLLLEDAATGTGLATGPSYTTAAYSYDNFQGPPLRLTGTFSDRGGHAPNMDRLPFEELVVLVELEAAAALDVVATANLHAEDGGYVATAVTVGPLPAGLSMLELRFRASSIFAAGQPGPYTVQLLSVAGGPGFSLQVPGVVALTQPYRLEDFAESPRFTVGGTITGLAGAGLVLELVAEGPSFTPPVTELRRSANGPFTFTFPRLVSGNPYEVRVKTHPVNPVQVCTVNDGAGTIEGADITTVEIRCS